MVNCEDVYMLPVPMKYHIMCYISFCLDLSCLWNQFACSKNKCIAKQWLCDGEDDCGDGLDESAEICGIKTRLNLFTLCWLKCVKLQIRVRSRAVSLLAAPGRPMRRRSFGPASSGLGEGLASWDVLVPSRSSDSLWRAGRMHADYGRQLYGVSSDALVWLISGLRECCAKKQRG